LRLKLAIIVIAMSFFAFLVYVPVAYKHAQILLTHQLYDRATFALNQLVQTGPLIENSDTFVGLVKPYAIGERGYIIAIDQTGMILTPHPDGQTHLKDIVRWSDIVARILSGEKRASVDFEEMRHLVSIPYGPYYLVSVMTEQDFFDELYPLITKSLIVWSVFGAVFVILAIFFIRGIAGPVSRVANAARAMMQNKKFEPIIVRTGDEIELLADEFSAMAIQLREYEEGLERKVVERTAQLETVNEQLKEKSMVLERVLDDVKKVDAELARLNRAKSDFISMASHQLRTPLTAIKWYTRILTNAGLEKFTPTQKRAFTQIQSANERMVDLVSALLNVSRIEMGTLAIEPKPIDFKKLLARAVDEVRPFAQEHGVALKGEALTSILATADANLANIILNNLLTNAIRYTPKGGHVTARLAQRKGRVIISVSDNGYGIPKKEQARLFDKFFRASNILDKEPQGTGLGLYITKSIAEELGGKLSFTSQENKGSTFTVSLPKGGLKRREGTKKLLPMS